MSRLKAGLQRGGPAGPLQIFSSVRFALPIVENKFLSVEIFLVDFPYPLRDNSIVEDYTSSAAETPDDDAPTSGCCSVDARRPACGDGAEQSCPARTAILLTPTKEEHISMSNVLERVIRVTATVLRLDPSQIM